MMKFDSDSINQRISYNLSENPDWKPMLNNSVVSSLIRHTAEADSEIARYSEYLFNESRWDTSQNRSSVVSMANMLGYQPKRKKSAYGKLYISLDSKITHVGSTITLNSFESLKDESIRSDTSLYNNWIKPQAPVTVTPACTVRDSKGTNYIVISTSTLGTGECYTSLDIIQGVRKTKYIDIDTIRQIYTRSRLNKYLYIPFVIKDCEAADTISSRGLLNVYVVRKSGNEEVLDSYRVVDSLLLSSDGNQDVELYNDLYNQELFYLKFRDSAYHGGSIDISSDTSIQGIRIDYVESLGSQSNEYDLYNTFYIDNAVIEGSNSGKTRLYGINYSPLEGGADEETISEIKSNAPKEYIKYYGIATKENYQRTILNSSFPIEINDNVLTIVPKKVQVYGGYIDQGGLRNPVTNVSFIGTHLEDLVNSNNSTTVTEALDKSLNYILSRLKSPQDTVKFVAPLYTSFALGVKCSIRNNNSEVSNLGSQIKEFLDSRWSPNSSSLDFNRSFYKSEEVTEVMKEFPGYIRNISMEVEAVKKLNWEYAERINPYNNISSDAISSSMNVYTVRIPFDFSSIFKGSLSSKEGFKDYDTSSPYVMRFDFLYKAPQSLAGDLGLNRSLFVDSGLNGNGDEPRSRKSFYVLRESSGFENVWPLPEEIISNLRYSEIGKADKIDKTYLIDFKRKVYDDDDYYDLVRDISKGKVALRNETSRGTIPNYFIYFSGDYTTESASNGTIGSGWIELTFDEMYSVLREYALYDSNVASELAKCPLSTLKCGTSEASNFSVFKNLISNYLEIYVSMRPNDSNLELQSNSVSKSSGFLGSNEILYIDSYDDPITDDSDNTSKTTNLTTDKKARFISVDCTYADF